VSSICVSRFIVFGVNLIFGLQPVIHFRAGLIAAQHVEFVGPGLYTLFQWKLRFDGGSVFDEGRV
jgi:hypothetical protein